MDWIRSAYATKMRFSDDPLAPLVDVQWYFVDDVPPDRVVWFPGPTVFCSSNWETNRDVPDFQGTGEVFPDFPRRPWRNGRRPWRGNRNSPCGTPAQFLGLNTWPWVQEPIDGQNRPICCTTGQAAFAGVHAELGIKSTVAYEHGSLDCSVCLPGHTPFTVYLRTLGWADTTIGYVLGGWSALNGIWPCIQDPSSPCVWQGPIIPVPSAPSPGPTIGVNLTVTIDPVTRIMTAEFFGTFTDIFGPHVLDFFFHTTGPITSCCPENDMVFDTVNSFPTPGHSDNGGTFSDLAVARCTPTGFPPPHWRKGNAKISKKAALSSTVSYRPPASVSVSLSKVFAMSSSVTYSPPPVASGSLSKKLSMTSFSTYAPFVTTAGSLSKSLSISSTVVYP